VWGGEGEGGPWGEAGAPPGPALSALLPSSTHRVRFWVGTSK